MELQVVNSANNPEIMENPAMPVNPPPFIEANTKTVSLSHLKKDCTIPVFAKDNEITISHQDFIEGMQQCASQFFPQQDLSSPQIRVSHIIKGRIPEAIRKPASELLSHEKTTYYERMAFVIDIPNIQETVAGNTLFLSIGGVRAYNQENLYSKKSMEKFKIFIGFKNMVCTNLCLTTDGLMDDLKVSSIEELKSKMQYLIERYNRQAHIEVMKQMLDVTISQEQFAHLVGKMKLYNHLDKSQKKGLFELKTTDSQINTIVKNYVSDEAFKCDENGDISLWNLYNLFTDASKSNYIDGFLDKNCNAYAFINTLGNSIKNRTDCYFLHI